jgi:hypothetical protein
MASTAGSVTPRAPQLLDESRMGRVIARAIVTARSVAGAARSQKKPDILDHPSASSFVVAMSALSGIPSPGVARVDQLAPTFDDTAETDDAISTPRRRRARHFRRCLIENPTRPPPPSSARDDHRGFQQCDQAATTFCPATVMGFQGFWTVMGYQQIYNCHGVSKFLRLLKPS